jgi:hypothetical protein
MKHAPCLLLLLLLAALAARVQAQDAAGGMNPVLDPFAVTSKPVLPPPLPMKNPAVPLPSMAPPPAPVLAAALPAGLRVLMIRDNGVGLLGAANAEASSTPVVNGKPVRLGEQDYTAEVTASEIRLYTSLKGRLVWQGMLGGPAQVTPPVDMTQAHFIPPLSAGVSPGLRSSGSGASADTLIRKNGAQ